MQPGNVGRGAWPSRNYVDVEVRDAVANDGKVDTFRTEGFERSAEARDAPSDSCGLIPFQISESGHMTARRQHEVAEIDVLGGRRPGRKVKGH
jgi:hypothetical protein